MQTGGIADSPEDVAIGGLPIHDFGSRHLRLMRPYQRGTDVKILQIKLKVQDVFDPGPIDGVFGPRTNQAVRSFQRYYRLTVDGIVGPDTFWCLGESTGPYLGGAPRLGSRVLREGMRGGDVWILQNRLNIASETGVGVASGVFDAVTTTAVREFQLRYGLVSDGVVGQITVFHLKLRTWLGGRQLVSRTKGCDVRQLQRWLNSILGQPVLTEDGFFGPATEAQVRAYQKSVGIGADGIVGPVTFHNLGFATNGIGTEEGRILFRHQDLETNLWSIRSRTPRHGILNLTGELSIQPWNPVWSPNGQWIAYVGEDNQLYLIPGSGGTPKVLTDDVEFYQEVSWSPDSTTIAVTKTGGNIYLVDRVTGTASFLVRGTFPVWFPSGKRLALAGGGEEELALKAINTNGTGLITITTQTPPYHVLMISPNGAKILYTTPGASISIVMIVDVATGRVTQVPSGPLSKDYCPVWSPNGRLIAYSATNFNETLKYFSLLRVADDQGKIIMDIGLHQVFSTCRITWGPYSDRIAYVGSVPGSESTDIYSLPLFAAFATDLTEEVDSDQPMWTATR